MLHLLVVLDIFVLDEYDGISIFQIGFIFIESNRLLFPRVSNPVTISSSFQSGYYFLEFPVRLLFPRVSNPVTISSSFQSGYYFLEFHAGKVTVETPLIAQFLRYLLYHKSTLCTAEVLMIEKSTKVCVVASRASLKKCLLLLQLHPAK